MQHETFALDGDDTVVTGQRYCRQELFVVAERPQTESDALHSSAAVEIGDELDSVMIYDQRMAESARLLGIDTVAPMRSAVVHRVRTCRVEEGSRAPSSESRAVPEDERGSMPLTVGYCNSVHHLPGE